MSNKNASETLDTMREREIVDMLDGFGVPHREKWNRNGYYSLDNLFEWLRLGECRLIPEEGKLLLWIEVAVAFIRSTRPADPKVDHFGGRILVELREQRLNDQGEWVFRSFNGSLGEKIRLSARETAEGAVVRGIREELGDTEPRLKEEENVRPFLRPLQVQMEQCSYREAEFFPGLAVTHNRHRLEYEMPPHLYRHEYMSNAGGRPVRFIWVPY